MEVVQELASQHRVCKLAWETSVDDPHKQLDVLEQHVGGHELCTRVFGDASTCALQERVARQLEAVSVRDTQTRLRWLMEALALAIVRHDLHSVYHRYHELALGYVEAGNMPRAAAHWGKRHGIGVLLGDDGLIAEASLNAGTAYRSMGDADLCVAYLRCAVNKGLRSVLGCVPQKVLHAQCANCASPGTTVTGFLFCPIFQLIKLHLVIGLIEKLLRPS